MQSLNMASITGKKDLNSNCRFKFNKYCISSDFYWNPIDFKGILEEIPRISDLSKLNLHLKIKSFLKTWRPINWYNLTKSTLSCHQFHINVSENNFRCFRVFLVPMIVLCVCPGMLAKLHWNEAPNVFSIPSIYVYSNLSFHLTTL